jgi:hypothetical protein
MPKKSTTQHRSPQPSGVHIPLSFDKAVEGLLAIKPKKAEKPKKKPAKK